MIDDVYTTSISLIEIKFFGHRILSFDREAAFYFAFIAYKSKAAGVNYGVEDLQIVLYESNVLPS
jgi:hypothetical protein